MPMQLHYSTSTLQRGSGQGFASCQASDAKATETPGNAATSDRLDRHARALAGWVRW